MMVVRIRRRRVGDGMVEILCYYGEEVLSIVLTTIKINFRHGACSFFSWIHHASFKRKCRDASKHVHVMWRYLLYVPTPLGRYIKERSE